MDGELVMCPVENNNNNKITRKQQQHNNKISKQCVYLKQVIKFTLTFVSVSCIILQLYKPMANSKQQFHTHLYRNM